MSVNKITLIGNVGQDPKIETFGENKKATFSVATTERGYTKRDGTKVEDKTEWHNCQVWRGLADVVEKYVHKGTQVFVEGVVHHRKYNDNNNVERIAYEVEVKELQLLGSKSDTAQQAPQPTASPSVANTVQMLNNAGLQVEQTGEEALPF